MIGADSDPDSVATGGLNTPLAAAHLGSINLETVAKFELYLSLILRWNAKTNLTAVRDPAEIVSRHFIESIACARALPADIRTLLDYGSGAGFPGIPIAICRPEILVTLAESQNKKSAFLREAVRQVGLSSRVFAERAETLTEQFDCVAVRAVDHMNEAVSASGALIRPGGWLAAMTTIYRVPSIQDVAGEGFRWQEPLRLPGSDQRVLALGVKTTSPTVPRGT